MNARSRTLVAAVSILTILPGIFAQTKEPDPELREMLSSKAAATVARAAVVIADEEISGLDRELWNAVTLVEKTKGHDRWQLLGHLVDAMIRSGAKARSSRLRSLEKLAADPNSLVILAKNDPLACETWLLQQIRKAAPDENETRSKEFRARAAAAMLVEAGSKLVAARLVRQFAVTREITIQGQREKIEGAGGIFRGPDPKIPRLGGLALPPRYGIAPLETELKRGRRYRSRFKNGSLGSAGPTDSIHFFRSTDRRPPHGIEGASSKGLLRRYWARARARQLASLAGIEEAEFVGGSAVVWDPRKKAVEKLFRELREEPERIGRALADLIPKLKARGHQTAALTGSLRFPFRLKIHDLRTNPRPPVPADLGDLRTTVTVKL
jgi:hypothetical protein